MSYRLDQKDFSCQSFRHDRCGLSQSPAINEGSIHDAVFWSPWNNGKKSPEKNRLGAATTWVSERGRKPTLNAASRTAVASWAFSSFAGRMSAATASFRISGQAGREDFVLFAPIAIVPIVSTDHLTSSWDSFGKSSGILGKYRSSMPETPGCSGIARYSRQSVLPWQLSPRSSARIIGIRRIYRGSAACCRHKIDLARTSTCASPAASVVINRGLPVRMVRVRAAWSGPASVPNPMTAPPGADVGQPLSGQRSLGR
jgi:hypothetical protein